MPDDQPNNGQGLPPSGAPTDEEERLEQAQERSISELETELAAAPSPNAPVEKPKPQQAASASLANLASLRERVLSESLSADQKPASVPAAAPTPPIPQRPPLTPADSTAAAPASLPSSAEPDMHALERAKEKKEPFLGTVRPVRTFRDDISNVVERRKISLVSAIAAEEDERSRKRAQAEALQAASPQQLSSGSYFLLGMSTVLFLFGGLVLGGYFVFFKEEPAIGVPAASLPSIIFTELQTQLDVTGMQRDDLLAALQSEKDRINLRLGAITGVYPIVNDTGYRLMGSYELLTALETRAPQPLVRALSPYFMLGIHEFDGNEPFFIFKTDSYEISYAGMLEWEPMMSLDLAPFFGRVALTRALTPAEEPEDTGALPGFVAPSATSVASIATTTARASTSTSGPLALPPPDPSAPVDIGDPDAPSRPEPPRFATGRFEDAVIRNKEVRVLRNADRKIVLLYSFIDPSTIVITTNEYTFIEVLTRYSSRRL